MLLPPFNLNLLRSLDVLLETRNLTASAKVLGLTQSALSRQLAQLRGQLDDPLLIREGQRYVLTQRGEALRGPLKAVLANMESVLDTPRFDPAHCTRQFLMAGSDYIAEYMLPEIVRKIAPQAPRLRIGFRMWEQGNFRLLSDEGVDLVATITDMLPDNLHGKAMGEDKPVCVMRATHPLAGQALHLDDYVKWPHMRIAGGSDKDSFAEQYLAKLGLQREVLVSVPLFAAAQRIVTDNDFLLTVPEHIAVALARWAPIVWKPLPFDVHTYRYWLLWHSRNHHDLAHQWFRHQVFEVLNESIHGITHFNLDQA